MAADPATAEERLRELIREAHGAAKDLRQAIREAKALDQQLAKDLLANAETIQQAQYDKLTDACRQLIDHLSEEGQKATAHVAELAGAGSVDEVMTVIAQAGAEEFTKWLATSDGTDFARVVESQSRGPRSVVLDFTLSPLFGGNDSGRTDEDGP